MVGWDASVSLYRLHPAGQTVPPLPEVLVWSLRRCLCGLWRCCLDLKLRRYCRFLRLKALGWSRSGSSERAPYYSWPRATSDEVYGMVSGLCDIHTQEHHLWLCLVDIGMLKKFGSSRFLYPRLASSWTQPVTWPSSSLLHRSRLRRSNTSCLGGQLLPPPVRRLQCPACSSQRTAPWVRPCSRTTSAAAFKSGAVELGVGRPSWPPSTGGERRSKRPQDGTTQRERELLCEKVSESLPPPGGGPVG